VTILNIKTQYLARVRRYADESSKSVYIYASSLDDATAQANDLYFEVIWIRENGVHKEDSND
jgi:hypothetical protein